MESLFHINCTLTNTIQLSQYTEAKIQGFYLNSSNSEKKSISKFTNPTEKHDGKSTRSKTGRSLYSVSGFRRYQPHGICQPIERGLWLLAYFTAAKSGFAFLRRAGNAFFKKTKRSLGFSSPDKQPTGNKLFTSVHTITAFRPGLVSTPSGSGKEAAHGPNRGRTRTE